MPADPTQPLAWTQPAFVADAHAWIDARLAEHGAHRQGPIEQPHVRAWSTAMRAETSAGPVWFKANMAIAVHEAAVVEILARRAPDRLPELLAVDRARGWMLMADGGQRLRELVGSPPSSTRPWADVLPAYAALQTEAIPDRPALLEAGARDRGLERLPGLYGDLTADTARLQPPLPCALAPEEIELLRARRQSIQEEAAQLATLGIPETIQHDDLHDGQIFVRDGRYLFFDWGDACVSHPFFTMTVTLAVLEHQLGLTDDSPEIEELRDAYLEPFTAFAPRKALTHAFPLALRLGAFARLTAWRDILNCMPPAAALEYADIVPERLRALLEG